MNKKNDDEMTEIERRLAERAATEEVGPSDQQTEPQVIPFPGVPEREVSMFEKEWEPPQRPLYDYEVVALVNRDCGRYAQAGLMLDSIEDVDAFCDQQLESYFQWMSDFQVSYYRITIAELLFKAVLNGLIQMQAQSAAVDKAVYNQIAQEAQRPSKKRRNGN